MLVLIDKFIRCHVICWSHDHKPPRGTAPKSKLLVSACGWAMSVLSTQIENEVLISEVFVRAPLWQADHPQHKSKPKKRALWAEVAAAVLPGGPRGVSAVQTRWKTLRDRFRRILKNIRAEERSGKGVEDDDDEIEYDEEDENGTQNSKRPSWCHYRQLTFLRDQMEGRPTSGNMDTPAENEETAESLLLGICEYNEDIDEMSLPGPTTATSLPVPSTAALPGPSTTTLSAVPASSPDRSCQSTQKKRKRLEEVVLQQLDSVNEEIAAHQNKKRDPLETYALSLIPLIEKVPPENMLKLRIKILQAIEECQ
ncbi:uncharacterized protein LOC144153063 [Haemaphysalis longicornis]